MSKTADSCTTGWSYCKSIVTAFYQNFSPVAVVGSVSVVEAGPPPAAGATSTPTALWSGQQSACVPDSSPSYPLPICSAAPASTSTVGGTWRGDSARALNGARDAPEESLQSPFPYRDGANAAPCGLSGDSTVITHDT